MYAATPQAFNPAFCPNDLLTATDTTATHHRLFPTAADAVTSEHTVFPTDTGAGEHIFSTVTSQQNVFPAATDTSQHNVFHTATTQDNVDIPEGQMEVVFPSDSEVRNRFVPDNTRRVGDNSYREFAFGSSEVYNVITGVYTNNGLADITDISDLEGVTATIPADWPLNGLHLWDPDSLWKLTE